MPQQFFLLLTLIKHKQEHNIKNFLYIIVTIVFDNINNILLIMDFLKNFMYKNVKSEHYIIQLAIFNINFEI